MPSAAASPVAAELPAAPPVDVEATSIEPRVQARLELPGGPDHLAATVELNKFDDQGHVPVAFGRAWVLVDDANRLVGVADDASDVDVEIDLDTRCIQLATSEDVWVRTGGRFLRRVDADTMEVVEDLEAPEASGGSVLVAYDSVWATAYDDAVLYRVAPTP